MDHGVIDELLKIFIAAQTVLLGFFVIVAIFRKPQLSSGARRSRLLCADLN